MTYVLGLKPSIGKRYFGWHDAGACLLKNGKIVSAVEEERFTRNKRAPQTFPKQSIQYVLDDNNLEINDIDAIAIGRDTRVYSEYIKQYPLSGNGYPISKRVLGDLYRTAQAYRGKAKKIVKNEINNIFGEQPLTADFYEIPHHRCHAASAHYCAPFDKHLTITIDAQGEYDSTVVWDDQLTRIKTFPRHNSVGYLYSRGAKYLGYRGGQDAGKVMGLAPYGKHRKEFEEYFDELIPVSKGTYDASAIPNASDPVELFESYFGERRVHPEEFTQRHKDFAYHLQLKTEEIVKSLCKYYIENSQFDKLSLAGGVAMNCKTNREVMNLDCIEDLFIQPAANDSGICLGAALEGHKRHVGLNPDPEFSHVYFGPKYDNDRIKSSLEGYKLEYQTPDDICRRTAELLADGNLVGWFQGRMEFGARALGNRSILADPRTEESLNRVNKNVKNREPWRPFAPSLKYEARDEYLVGGDESPYMILLDTVQTEKRDQIPAVTHVDGTTRPQTVRKQDNKKYYRLIEEFESITGVPVLLNTSFNVSGEPIVESPAQAIQDFYSTGLDALAIGDHLLQK